MKPLHCTLSVVLAASLLAACGGGEAESSASAPEPAATPQAEQPQPEPPAATEPAASTDAVAGKPQASELAGDPRGFPRPAPELKFTARDGRQVALSQLKGKAVAVFFFSTDCPHCQRSAEVMAPIYAELKGQGVEILGLAMNPTAETNLGAFVEKYNVQFPVTTTTRQEFARFAGLSVMSRFYYPYYLFVDPQGNLVEEHQGSDTSYFRDLNSSLRATFARLLS